MELKVCLENNTVRGYFWYDLTNGYSSWEDIIEEFKGDLLDKVEDTDPLYKEIEDLDVEDIDFEITDVECSSNEWNGDASELVGYSLNDLLKLKDIMEANKDYGVKVALWEEYVGSVNLLDEEIMNKVVIVDFEKQSYKSEDRFIGEYILEELIKEGNIESVLPYIIEEEVLRDIDSSSNSKIDSSELEDTIRKNPDLLRNNINYIQFKKSEMATGEWKLSYIVLGDTDYIGRIDY